MTLLVEGLQQVAVTTVLKEDSIRMVVIPAPYEGKGCQDEAR